MTTQIVWLLRKVDLTYPLVIAPDGSTTTSHHFAFTGTEDVSKYEELCKALDEIHFAVSSDAIGNPCAQLQDLCVDSVVHCDLVGWAGGMHVLLNAVQRYVLLPIALETLFGVIMTCISRSKGCLNIFVESGLDHLLLALQNYYELNESTLLDLLCRMTNLVSATDTAAGSVLVAKGALPAIEYVARAWGGRGKDDTIARSAGSAFVALKRATDGKPLQQTDKPPLIQVNITDSRSLVDMIQILGQPLPPPSPPGDIQNFAISCFSILSHVALSSPPPTKESPSPPHMMLVSSDELLKNVVLVLENHIDCTELLWMGLRLLRAFCGVEDGDGGEAVAASKEFQTRCGRCGVLRFLLQILCTTDDVGTQAAEVCVCIAYLQIEGLGPDKYRLGTPVFLLSEHVLLLLIHRHPQNQTYFRETDGLSIVINLLRDEAEKQPQPLTKPSPTPEFHPSLLPLLSLLLVILHENPPLRALAVLAGAPAVLSHLLWIAVQRKIPASAVPAYVSVMAHCIGITFLISVDPLNRASIVQSGILDVLSSATSSKPMLLPSSNDLPALVQHLVTYLRLESPTASNALIEHDKAKIAEILAGLHLSLVEFTPNARDTEGERMVSALIGVAVPRGRSFHHDATPRSVPSTAATQEAAAQQASFATAAEHLPFKGKLQHQPSSSHVPLPAEAQQPRSKEGGEGTDRGEPQTQGKVTKKGYPKGAQYPGGAVPIQTGPPHWDVPAHHPQWLFYHLAATRIQSVVRGHLVRTVFLDMARKSTSMGRVFLAAQKPEKSATKPPLPTQPFAKKQLSGGRLCLPGWMQRQMQLSAYQPILAKPKTSATGLSTISSAPTTHAPGLPSMHAPAIPDFDESFSRSAMVGFAPVQKPYKPTVATERLTLTERLRREKQAFLRAYCYDWFARQTHAAVQIQKTWRGFETRKWYRKVHQMAKGIPQPPAITHNGRYAFVSRRAREVNALRNANAARIQAVWKGATTRQNLARTRMAEMEVLRGSQYAPPIPDDNVSMAGSTDADAGGELRMPVSLQYRGLELGMTDQSFALSYQMELMKGGDPDVDQFLQVQYGKLKALDALEKNADLVHRKKLAQLESKAADQETRWMNTQVRRYHVRQQMALDRLAELRQLEERSLMTLERERLNDFLNGQHNLTGVPAPPSGFGLTLPPLGLSPYGSTSSAPGFGYNPLAATYPGLSTSTPGLPFMMGPVNPFDPAMTMPAATLLPAPMDGTMMMMQGSQLFPTSVSSTSALFTVGSHRSSSEPIKAPIKYRRRPFNRRLPHLSG